MDLQSKIFNNLVKQLEVNHRIRELRQQLEQVERESTAAIGAMQLLAEMYEEETGGSLQQALNTDPTWRKLIEDAEKRAQGNIIKARDPVVTAPTPAVEIPEPAPQPTVMKPVEPPALPKLQRVKENKIVAVEEPVAPPQPTQRPATQIRSVGTSTPTTQRSKAPVEIVIDDNPPSAPPGTTARDDDEDGG